MIYQSPWECKWTIGHQSKLIQAYKTECGNEHAFHLGAGPTENGFNYCPYCGNRIVLDEPTPKIVVIGGTEAA